MKNITSLLVSTASALIVVGSASAADLPSRKAAPVEYVRVCNTYGAGFFYIPGSETCLRLSGRVRAEYRYEQPFKKEADATGFLARGRIAVDARTATAYGTLRTFVRYDITRSSGAYSELKHGAAVDNAFVQFGPFTAGRATSMFDYANAQAYGTIRGSDTATQLFAYTASFGSGYSATLSLEDGVERSNNSSTSKGGNRLPDVVANLNVTQGWGTVQLSGAVHEITTNSVGAAAKLESKYGFAGQASMKFKLPMLAAGDVLWLQGAYAEGALGYLGATGEFKAGGIKVRAYDSVVVTNDLSSSVKLTKGYALAASLLHYWTPTIRQAVFGSFVSIESNKAAGQTDFKEYRVGSQLVWSPVSGLDIGVEVLYAKVDPKGRVADGNRSGDFKLASDDAVSARFRVQRDF